MGDMVAATAPIFDPHLGAAVNGRWFVPISAAG